MKTVNVHEAKTTLSQLISAVERGEEIVIARNGVPVVRLVRVEARMPRTKGLWRTQPGWENYQFDPAVLAPLETDQQLAEAGWPV